MAKPDPKTTEVVLKNVRLSFPHLFEPSQSTDDSDPKFRAAFLIDPNTEEGKANFRRMLTAVKAACEAEWGDPERYKTIKADRVCFGKGETQVSQETGQPYDGYPGMLFAKASSPMKRRPQVVGRRLNPVTEADGIIYGGCYVNAMLRVYTITDKKRGGNGVFATLEAVQFFRDGQPFGAGPVDVNSVFDDLGDDFADDGAAGDDDTGLGGDFDI